MEFLNLWGMKLAFWACLIVEATGLVHAVWFLCVVFRKLLYKCVCPAAAADSDFSHVARVSSVEVNAGMVETAKQAEIDIEKEVELGNQERDPRDVWKAEYIAHNDDIDDQMNSLIQKVGNRRDLFYIYGDSKYMSPSQCYDKFKNSGMSPPRFLLPPDNEQHIPPHIIAMTLLKMYTEKCQQMANMTGHNGHDEDAEKVTDL